MEVEILKLEYVKPSSPTPSHLRVHKLSSLDQCLHPHYYYPVYLFYLQINNNSSRPPEERCNRIKGSLSRILTFYRPFAGTVRDQSSLLCDDHGVAFTHAQVKFPLSTFLRSRDLIERLPKLLPRDQSAADMTMVQVTGFSCGGFAIAAVFSHAVADAVTLCTFLKTWASLCREPGLTSTQLRWPSFTASVHFPPADRLPEKGRMVPHFPPFVKKGKLRVRRLVFGPTGIQALKHKATSPMVPNPSRAEVVSAHLVNCIMSAAEATSGSRKAAMVSQIVNLRRRAEPPLLPEGPMIGNYFWPVSVLGSGDLIYQLRRASSEIDGHFVARLKAMGTEQLFEELEKVHSSPPPETEFIQTTSCCNLGIYETDFGWGKPIWVCFVGPPAAEWTEYINLVMLSDTRSGDGVEALVFVDEQDSVFLEEGCQDLVAYSVFDQDPLISGLDPQFSKTRNNQDTRYFPKL